MEKVEVNTNLEYSRHKLADLKEYEGNARTHNKEQIMQIANVLAGYSLGEADVLRRAMNKKKEEAPAAPAPPPADIQLLTEIRDLLKDKK